MSVICPIKLKKITIIIMLHVLLPLILFSQQFSERADIASGARSPATIIPEDIDSDGDIDILYLAKYDRQILWSENLGNGDFATQKFIAFAENNQNLLIFRDMDGDGDKDILRSEGPYTPGRILMHENLGQVDFAAEELILEPIIAVTAMEVFDIDSDGDLDIITGNSSSGISSIHWHENDGSGIFSNQQFLYTLDSGIDPSQFCWGDIDGDGDQDFAFVVTSPQRLIWMENMGNQNYLPHEILSYSNNSEMSLSLIDVDSDSDQDFILTYGYNKISYFLNDGVGSFVEPVIIESEYNGVNSNYCADINGDGQLDLVVTSDFYNNIVWYDNIFNGTIGVQQVLTTNDEAPTLLEVFDIENDGDLDIVYASLEGHYINGMLNLGSGEFDADFIIAANTFGALTEFASDLDGDGDLDVLSGTGSDNKLSWYENKGDNTFGHQKAIQADDYSKYDVISFDVDLDGDMDVVASGAQFSGSILYWFENNGEGEFGLPQTITTEISATWMMLTSDIDQDGILDLISASQSENKLAWYKNNGNGTFGSQQIISVESIGVVSIETGDIDLDGDNDIVSANISGNNVMCFTNNGDGNFTQAQTFEFLESVKTVHLVDLDNDQDEDLIYNYEYSRLAYRINDGTGNFGEQEILLDNEDGLSLSLQSDVDGDGDFDILVVYSTGLFWMENYGGLVFSGKKEINPVTEEYGTTHNWSISNPDLSGDGYVDVLIASQPNRVYWNENFGNQGCTDTSACNFNDNAIEENGTCCYDECGCTDQNAINFNEIAICDNGSCEYRIEGLVFNDINENGIYDTDDYGLAFQEITASNGEFALTNDLGIFYLDLGVEETNVSLTEPEEFPYSTRQNPQVFENGINQMYLDNSLDFGLSSSIPDFELEANIYASGNEYLCDDPNLHNVCFRNMGNLPIDGVVELIIDSLFQGFEELTPIDSVAGNTIFMSFSNLLPGQMFCYDILLQTPTVDYIGSFISTSVVVYGYYEDDQAAFGESSSNIELTCSYDPNDKQVFPAGYSEMHYIESDTLLEYLIRFQNTGNAPAQNIHIIDTIDANFDLESFQLLANSHSVSTSISTENRVIDFFFENIELPDSVNNEPESHGLISYRIRPEPDLPLLTELNNTAYIFFDNNPPIITNTTWSTLYNCTLFEVEISNDGAILTASDGDTYQWFLEGVAIPDAVNQQFSLEVIGNYSVEVNSDFPCYGISNSIYISVIGIEELLNEDLVLFPNPMSDLAYINLGVLNGNYSIEVIDVKGSVLNSENVEISDIGEGFYTLKRKNMAAGSYILRVLSDERSYEILFLVQ